MESVSGNSTIGSQKGHDIADEIIPKNGSATSDQVNFDDRFDRFMKSFQETCETEEVTCAIAIVLDPKIPEKPMLYMHGHRFETVALLGRVYSRLRDAILKELP